MQSEACDKWNANRGRALAGHPSTYRSRRMKQLLAAASVCALMIAAPAWAQTSGTQTTTGNETTTSQSATGARGTTGAQPSASRTGPLSRQAGAGSLAEADLGNLAVQKGATPAVREFGRWMYTDHGLVANNWLKAIMSAQGETLQPTLTAEQKQMRRKLEGSKRSVSLTRNTSRPRSPTMKRRSRYLRPRPSKARIQ